MSDETSSRLRERCFQNFKNAKTYIVIYYIMIMMIAASNYYFAAILTTIEKRFKVSSQTTGVIMIGDQVAQLLASGGLSYYANKGNKPRWIAAGTHTIMLCCILAMLPHFLYGPGENALQLTEEYSGILSNEFLNKSFMQMKERNFLCLPENDNPINCEKLNGNLIPQVLLTSSRFLLGIGNSIITAVGMAYLDDSIPKSQAPFLLGCTSFIKLIGPAIGFGISSYTLGIYISPRLHPTIAHNDPRWMGVWWLGWIIFTITFFITSCIIILFPKSLPVHISTEINHNDESVEGKNNNNQPKSSPSWADLKTTLMRLIKNEVFTLNTLSLIFLNFCFTAYSTYISKYIQIQYKNTAANSTLLLVGVIIAMASASGSLSFAAIISKYKPKGRKLVAWNIISSILVVLGTISYTFLGCTANDNQPSSLEAANISSINSTNNCNCDFVTFNPVCSSDGQTFISACHAGCQNLTMDSVGRKQYTHCTVRTSINTQTEGIFTDAGTAVPGSCPVDCQNKLYIFLAMIFLVVLIFSTSLPLRILAPMRSVDKEDKSVAIGLKLTLTSLGATIPAPIVYSYIFDKSCLVWGKTCTGTGNCWIYDAKTMSLLLNSTAAGFAGLAALSDIGVWYFIKNVKLFDDKKINE